MKIGILTFQFVDNYGAVLQAYALKYYLENLGNQVEILNYNNSTRRSISRSKVNRLKSFVWKCVRRIIAGTRKHNSFNNFRVRYLNLKKEELNLKKDLIDYIEKEKFSIVITGSDQVWNPSITGDDTAYLLDFPDNVVRKGSYAASFGKSSIDEKWAQLVVANITKYKAISVRERTAADILYKSGYSGKVEVVSDPVFLLEKNDWLKSVCAKTACDYKYVLCYIMPGDKYIEYCIEQSAKLYGKANHVKVVFLGRKEYKKFYLDGKDCYDASPEEFLTWICNADCVFTNSFHGTAFSIIFKKNFYSFVNPNLSNNVKLSTRLTDLLDFIGLNHRCVSDVCRNTEEIDYSAIDGRLRDFVFSSRNYIIHNFL